MTLTFGEVGFPGFHSVGGVLKPRTCFVWFPMLVALSPFAAAIVLFSSDPASETLPFTELYKLEQLHFLVTSRLPFSLHLVRPLKSLDFSKPLES